MKSCWLCNFLLTVFKYTYTAQLYPHRHISDLKWHFVIDWVKSIYTNTVDVGLKTQLLYCYLCRSWYVVFPSSKFHFVPNLKGRTERVQLLFTCNDCAHIPSCATPLPLLPGRRKLHRFRKIRHLTKWEKDIIPFVLVKPIPCEV